MTKEFMAALGGSALKREDIFTGGTQYFNTPMFDQRVDAQVTTPERQATWEEVMMASDPEYEAMKRAQTKKALQMFNY